MADRELIAAILTAGMLPTLEVPQSRARGRSGSLPRAEADAIKHAVDHAFGVYRLVLNGLGVDQFAVGTETTIRPEAAATAAREGMVSQFGRDAPGAESGSEIDHLKEAHAPAN